MIMNVRAAEARSLDPGESSLRASSESLSQRGVAATGGGDGFKSGVDAERPEETADVVPDRLGAQMELGGDLLGRAALLQEPKHLDLAGVRCGCGAVACRRGVLQQPEDADDPFTVHERHGADLHGHPLPRRRDRTPVASVAGAVPSTLRVNSSRARRLSSGATTEVIVATANVAKQPLGCRIDPATIPVVSTT